MSQAHISLIQQSDFTHLSLSNKHSAVLGIESITQTAQYVQSSEMQAVDQHLRFQQIDSLRVATLGINLVPDALGHDDQVPSISIAQQIRLAKILADKLIISEH